SSNSSACSAVAADWHAKCQLRAARTRTSWAMGSSSTTVTAGAGGALVMDGVAITGPPFPWRGRQSPPLLAVRASHLLRRPSHQTARLDGDRSTRSGLAPAASPGRARLIELSIMPFLPSGKQETVVRESCKTPAAPGMQVAAVIGPARHGVSGPWGLR